MRTRSSRPSRRTPLGLVAVLLVSLLAAAAPGQAHHAGGPHDEPQQAGEVLFLDGSGDPLTDFSDPENPVHARVYGTGAVVRIGLTDADLTDEVHEVQVTSNSDSSGETIRLHRSAPRVYEGFVGFEAQPVAANGLVHVRNGDGVSVVYVDDGDASGRSSVSQDVVVWRAGHIGQVDLDATTYHGAGTVVDVRVTDLDRDASTFQVRATSGTDETGIVVELSRVGNGVYEGSFALDTTGGAGVLEVEDGDTVRVEYEQDGFDPRGHPEKPFATATWKESHHGRVQFTTESRERVIAGSFVPKQESEEGGEAQEDLSLSDVPRLLDVHTGKATDPGTWIRVEDPDLRHKSKITVNLRSLDPNDPNSADVDPTGIHVTLDETGNRTGEFIGIAGFITGQPSTSEQLRVKDGAIVEARYSDDTDREGEHQVRTASLIWSQPKVWFSQSGSTADTGSVTYDVTEQSGACGGEGCVTTQGQVQVRDAALAGLNEVDVQITSTLDPHGITVTLQEVGNGLFSGTFNFGHGGSSMTVNGPFVPGPTIWALHGHTLTAVYAVHDASREDTQHYRAAASTTTTPEDQNERPAKHAQARVLLKSSADASAGAVSFKVGATVHVEVKDPIVNLDNESAESVQVLLMTAPEADSPWSTREFTFTLEETGTNTSIFRGSLDIFNDLGDPGDVLCAFYLHRNENGTTSKRLSDCADIVHGTPHTTARIIFRDEAHQGINATSAQVLTGEGRGHILVWDPDNAADKTAKTDTVKVNVRSETDRDGIDIVLRERYGRNDLASCQVAWGGCDGTQDDRAFIGSFDFTTGNSVAGKALQVTHRDTITASYVDQVTASGAQQTAVAHVKWERSTGAQLLLDSDTYRHDGDDASAANRVEITVADPDANKDNAARDTLIVSAVSKDADDKVETIALRETSAASGLFKGNLRLERQQVIDTTGLTPDPQHLAVYDEDTITVRYDDEHDRAGEAQVHEASATWFDVTSSGLTLDRPKYTTYSANAKITLEDPDLDVKVDADRVVVWVTSDSDGRGERVVLTETGGSTGVFTGGFGFTSEANTTERDGLLRVQDDDRLNVRYIDLEQDGDGLGDERAAKTVEAVWEIAANEPPKITITTDPALNSAKTVIVAPNSSVAIKVQASDADGAIASWKVDFGDGSTMAQGTGSIPDQFPHTFVDAKTYTVEVTAVDDDGDEGTASITVIASTGDVDAPGAVTGLKAEPSKTKVTLVWDAPENNADAEDGKAVDSYVVKVSEEKIEDLDDFEAASVLSGSRLFFAPEDLVGPDDEQRLAVSGLDPSTAYFFAVQARDNGGNTGPFETVSTSTLDRDTTAPTGLLGLRSSHQEGVEVEDRNITFTWSHLDEDESDLEYRFVLNKQQDHSITVNGQTETATTATSTTYRNQAPGTYYFHIAGCSEGGCSTTTTRGPLIIAAPDAGGQITEAQVRAVNAAMSYNVTANGTDNVVTWALPLNPPAPVEGVQVWIRTNGSFGLLQDVPSGTSAFTAGRFIHEDAPEDSRYLVTAYYGKDAGQGYGQSPDDVPGFDALGDGKEPVVLTAKAPIPLWFWIAIALGVVLVVLVATGLVLLRKRPEGSEDAEGSMAWAPVDEPETGAWDEEAEEASDEPWGDVQEPAGDEAWGDVQEPEGAFPEAPAEAPQEEYYDPGEGAAMAGHAPGQTEEVPEEPVDENTHHLNCPSCSADFTAHGPKPLVTECPSCGVRGILR